MKVKNNNIIMESGATVDGRVVSEDGKKLDAATFKNISNTLVMRNSLGKADLTVTSSDKLSTPREIRLDGDVTGNILFDGSSDVTIETTIQDDSHLHDTRYYTINQIDQRFADYSPGSHKHAYIRGGEGLIYFAWDGSEVVTINLRFAGSGGDLGTSSTSVARSDHKHDSLYYTKDETNSLFGSSLTTLGDFIRLLDNNGTINASIQAPWALKLGSALGQPGLSLNSTTLNNESNKVVRTDENGHTRFGMINLISSETTEPLSYIYVDNGDNYIKKSSIGHVLSEGGVSGNNVSQHYHTKLYSTSNPDSSFIFNEWDGTRWYLKNNSGAGVRVSYSDEAELASRAKYADYAEIYTIKEESIKEGTVLSISENPLFELEICDKILCNNVVGVISSEPGFVINNKDENIKNAHPVALLGKNPVRIIGSINKGDSIVSYGDGTATKLTDELRKKINSGDLPILGYALESNFNENEKLVMCFIK